MNAPQPTQTQLLLRIALLLLGIALAAWLIAVFGSAGVLAVAAVGGVVWMARRHPLALFIVAFLFPKP